MSKQEIKATLEDGEEVTIFVKKPNSKQQRESKVDSAAYVAELLRSGKRLMTKEEIDEMNPPSEKEQKQYIALIKKIVDGEDQLSRGGKTKDGEKFTKEQAKSLALNMRLWRIEQINFLLRNKSLYSDSLENIKDDRAFDYLVSCSCFYEDGSRVFSSVDDYLERADKDYAVECAKTLSNVMYGKDKDWTLELKENEFLINYGFADSKGVLLGEDGKSVLEEVEKEVEFTPFDEE